MDDSYSNSSLDQSYHDHNTPTFKSFAADYNDRSHSRNGNYMNTSSYGTHSTSTSQYGTSSSNGTTQQYSSNTSTSYSNRNGSSSPYNKIESATGSTYAPFNALSIQKPQSQQKPRPPQKSLSTSLAQKNLLNQAKSLSTSLTTSTYSNSTNELPSDFESFTSKVYVNGENGIFEKMMHSHYQPGYGSDYSSGYSSVGEKSQAQTQENESLIQYENSLERQKGKVLLPIPIDYYTTFPTSLT